MNIKTVLDSIYLQSIKIFTIILIDKDEFIKYSVRKYELEIYEKNISSRR